MTRFAFALLALGLFGPLPAAAQSATLEIVGTGDGLEMLRALARDYMKSHEGTKVDVPPSIGSGGGIAAVGAGKAVLGRVARVLSDSEREAGIAYVPIAKLPSSFFANPDAKVKSITAAQLTGVYAGKITNWKDVGGADLRIRVVRREDIDSTLVILRASMPGWKDLRITDRSKMATSTQEAIESVRTVSGAIGFAPYSKQLEDGLSVLKIDGLHPVDEGYPSNNVLALIYLEKSVPPHAMAFVKYSKSPQARKIISDFGGVPVK